MRGVSILASGDVQDVVASSGDGVEFLTTADPKEVWSAPIAGAITLDIDLGAATQIDTVFLGFATAAPGTQWSIAATTSIAGANPAELLAASEFSVAAGVDPRRHGLALLEPSVVTQFLRVTITPAGAGTFEVGALLVGKRFDHAYEYKAGRRAIDMSQRTDLAGGGFGFSDGAIKSSFRMTISDLDDSEVDDLWRLVRRIGNQSPILLVEGGDVPVDQEMVHYGVFERFEAFEREDPQDTRWSLSMQDWV